MQFAALGVGWWVTATAAPLSGASWSAEGDQAGAQLGWTTASAGDVNGDGFDDVAVGAFRYDGGEANEGRAFLYFGSPVGLSPTADWIAECDQVHAGFAKSVATAGDVNGDGYGDLIVGAYLFDDRRTDEGAAFLYLGSASGPSASPAWRVVSNQRSAGLGNVVGSAGDVNGDGYDDVLVAASYFDGRATDEGAGFLYLGGPRGLSGTPAWSTTSGQAACHLGRAIGRAGDVNGDGYDDVAVGGHGCDGREGRVSVWLGSPGGLSQVADWTTTSGQVGSGFGEWVATAGDVDGDGFDDLLVGAYGYDGGQVDEGAAFLYRGSATGLETSPAWRGEGGQADAHFGNSVAAAGDVNGDGYDDVLVGASDHDDGESQEGQVSLYLGSPAGLAARPAATVTSDQAGARLGFSVATAGDVDGDGFDDVVMGAHAWDHGQTDEGGAFLFPGRP